MGLSAKQRLVLVAPCALVLTALARPSHCTEFADKLDMYDSRIRIRRPAGAAVTYTPGKSRYCLGEPIYVVFRVENNGDRPISFHSGGDYRNSPRSLRFVLRAVDSRGDPVPDPHPAVNCMGGLGGLREVGPGKAYEQRLLLQTWCEINRPGEYTVTAGQDIAWDEPVEALSTLEWSRSMGGRFTVELVKPSEEDTSSVIDAMVREVRTSDNVWRARQPFAYICHPAYVEPLRRISSDGNSEVREAAVAGLGSILTPKATLALIDLLDHRDPATALLAAETLNWRLPHPDPDRVAAMRSPFVYEQDTESKGKRRKDAVRLAWRDEFRGRVVANAREMLRSGDEKAILAGVSVIWCFRDAASMDLLLSALDRYVRQEQESDPKWPEYGFGLMSGSAWGKTACALVSAGASPPTVGRIDTVGEALVWLYLVQGGGHRPRGWQADYVRCLGHANSLVRLVAVADVPGELAPRVGERFVALAGDAHETVRRATWSVAMRLKVAGFLPVVLERVRTETTYRGLCSACGYCVALGDRSHIDILIERLVEPAGAPQAHLVLYETTTDSGYGFDPKTLWTKEECRQLQAEWRTWFDVNGEALRKFGKLRPDDDRLTPRPTPRDFKVNY